MVLSRLCKHLGCSEAEGKAFVKEWEQGEGLQWVEETAGEAPSCQDSALAKAGSKSSSVNAGGTSSDVPNLLNFAASSDQEDALLRSAQHL